MKGFKKGAQCGTGLREAGERMGYKYGGQVKNTSSEFDMKTGAQNPMDPGVQPARKGRNQQEVEAGGTGRLRPGYAEGGKVMSRRQFAGKHGSTKGYRNYVRETLGSQYTDKEYHRMLNKMMDEGPGAAVTEAERESMDSAEGYAEGGKAKKNPYMRGTKRYGQWEAKHRRDKARTKKVKKPQAYATPGGALAKKWSGKSRRAMEEMGLRAGGPVAAKKGGLSRAVHNPTPMYGKK